MTRFHIATYNENEKKFVIVVGYQGISGALRDYKDEVLVRGTKRVKLLEEIEVEVDIDVSVKSKSSSDQV